MPLAHHPALVRGSVLLPTANRRHLPATGNRHETAAFRLPKRSWLPYDIPRHLGYCPGAVALCPIRTSMLPTHHLSKRPPVRHHPQCTTHCKQLRTLRTPTPCPANFRYPYGGPAIAPAVAPQGTRHAPRSRAPHRQLAHGTHRSYRFPIAPRLPVKRATDATLCPQAGSQTLQYPPQVP